MSSSSQSPQEPLGHRLKRRRKELGASLDQLAQWSGIDAVRLGEIEDGQPMRSWEFEAVSRGLAVDPGALARGGDQSPRRSVARFRSADWVEPLPGDLRLLSLAAELGRIGGFLASQSSHQASPLTDLRAPMPISGREEPWRQGYRLGENARWALHPKPGPIEELEALLIDRRVHVARVSFSSSRLDAASLWEADALPIILLNRRSRRTSSTLSRRSLLAHELCHLLHDSGDRDLTTQLTWGENAGNFNRETEQRARAFAPAFLAPRDEVRQWFRSGHGRRLRSPGAKVEELARRWGFSLRGAIWHAKNCQVISAKTAATLDRKTTTEDHEWSGDFERTRRDAVEEARLEPPETAAPIADGLLADLVAQAVAAGSISEGRGREIVSWV